MELFHSSPFGGHSGIKRTLRKISGRYYWPTLFPDVTSFVAECSTCQQVKAEHHRQQVDLGRRPPPTEPWEMISLDYAGPFEPCEDSEFKYILLAVDHFTGYLVTVPTTHVDAASTARALVDEVICKYGVPRRILTDQGSAFRNSLMSDLGDALSIKMSTTSAYHPQANGKTERYVGTLKQTLTSILDDFKGNWTLALQPATFAVNASPNSSTALSAYFLNHGRHPRLPRELPLPTEDNSAETAPREAYAYSLAQTLRYTSSIMREMFADQAALTQAQMENITRIPIYKEGDSVWLKDERFDTSIGGFHTAFAHPFKGPYRVLRRIGPATYLIRALRDGEPWGVTITIHGSRLRPDRSAEAPTTSTPAALASADPAMVDPTSLPALEPKSAPEASHSSSAASAAMHHRRKETLWRPNYAENASVPFGPRAASRFSSPPARKRARTTILNSDT